MKRFKAFKTLRVNLEANSCESCKAIFSVDRFEQGMLHGQQALFHHDNEYIQFCPYCGAKSQRRDLDGAIIN